MNLYLRLLKLVLLLPFTARTRDVLAESRLSFRVWPTDCDLNLHMNNGRYLTLMDLGRLHLVAQCGLLAPLFRHRWAPVLAAAEITFIRPLSPFARFALRTRILAWDEKYFYLEQRFEHAGALCALGMVRGLFVARRRPVPSVEVLHAAGVVAASPPMPALLSRWKDLTALKKQHAG